MAYWRMQMHPADGSGVRHASESLAANFIGLDFGEDRGDMTLITDPSVLPRGEQDYLDFQRRMAPGDLVLIIAHHYPFAIATVDGDYNYIRNKVPELKIWFRHFRRVKNVRYYGDRVTNPAEWKRLVMVDTISILNDPNTASYQLIQSWT